MILKRNQLAIASQIIEGARVRGLGDEGAMVGLVTALQESKLLMYANSTIRESLDYPHDAVGNDYDSLNFFQQRVRWWATGTTAERVAKLMDSAYAIEEFYKALRGIRGWHEMRPGAAAQAVQVSQYPDRYNQWVPAAATLITALGG